MTYLPFVDGLRALAICAVVAFHAFPIALPGGFAGVDVFFVISGFLITRFIAAEIEGGTFSLARFFVRRARRLLPAAVVCFAIVTLLAALVLMPDAFWYYGRSLLASALMYANFFFYNTGGYFSAPSLEKPLLHTWSLAVEDQFYLTWPLILMLVMPRVSRQVTLALIAVVVLASLAYAQVKVLRNPDFAFYMLPARAWELLIGAGLALSPAWPAMLSKAAAETLTALGLAGIAASCALLSPTSAFPGFAALPACLGTAAILAAGLAQPTALTRVLSRKPIVLLGLISYSLYLWHWPLIALASYRLERPLAPVEATGAAAVSLLLAYLSWRFVERPFRAPHDASAHYSWPPADRRFVAAAVAGIVGIAGLAGAIKILKGAPQRYGDSARHVLEQMVTGNPWRSSCDNFDKIFANDAFCNFGRKTSESGAYEVAMFGDSMADHWVPLVAAFAEEKKLAGRQATNGGCAFLVGVAIPAEPAAKARECASYQTQAQRFVDANPKLKLAVISAFWEKWQARINAVPAQPVFDRALAETVTYFTRRGIRVLLIGQIPTYQHLPVRCIVDTVEAGRDPAICGVAADTAQRELATSNAALNRAAAGNALVSVFLPSLPMCNAERCPPVVDGVMLYKNEGHINRFGAEYLSRFVSFPKLD